MSSNQDGQSSIETTAREQFEPARGSVPQQIDVAEDEHPIRQALGKSSHRKLQAHEGTLGQRFAFRYSRSEAFLREYLANSETGCIRRARYELKEVAPETYTQEWFNSHTIPELLEEARSVADYYPIIETHSSPTGASMDRFIIEDNGIGISVTEFVALKELGLSASHDEGSQLGQFGQGIMSVFNAVGEYGDLTLETWSRKDGANYRERFRIDGFNDLPGKREHYGTTWKIPAFSEEASDMDINDAIEEYTTAMYVPVIHHWYDEDGVKQGKEEYTYSPLSSLVPDTKPAFVYEDQYVEAVMSPEIKDPHTYLVSQPIKRGCSTKSFDAPFKFHLRIKQENGCIYESTHDDVDNTGLIPVENDRLESELIKSRNAIHPGQLLPGDIVAYDVDGYDSPVVPMGIDDELVSTIDDVILVDQSVVAHPSTDQQYSPIVIDGPHESLRLVDEETWNAIETDVESTYVSYSDLNVASRSDISNYSTDNNIIPSGYDIQLVQPVDDRDRFEEHDGALVCAISKKLNQKLRDESKELFAKIDRDGFGAFYDFTKHERDVFTVAYETYIGNGTKTTEVSVSQSISEVYDIDIDLHTAKQLSMLSRRVEYAARNSANPNRKSGRRETKISKIIRYAGTDGTIYMGATIHADKAHVVWEIHDANQVVAIDGSHMYAEYNELLGWVPLKTIKLRNIAERYDLPESFANKYERSTKSNHGGGVSMDDLDAATREIKIRSDRERRYTSKTPKEVKDQFEEDGYLHAHNDIEHLLVFPETEVGGVGAGRSVCRGSIGRTIVPNYVVEYLKDIDQCYVCENGNYQTALSEIRSSMLEKQVTVIDVSDLLGYDLGSSAAEYVRTYDPVESPTVELIERKYRDLGNETIGVVLNDRLRSLLDDDSGLENEAIYTTLTKSITNELDIGRDVTQIAILASSDIDSSVLVWNPVRDDLEGINLIRHADAPFNSNWNAKRWSPESSIKLDLLFPEERFPRDTIEWNSIVKDKSYKIRNDYDQGIAIVETLHHLAKHVPDDVPVFPSQIDDS